VLVPNILVQSKDLVFLDKYGTMKLSIIVYHIPSITTHLGWLFTQHVSTYTMLSSGVDVETGKQPN
jgi:hypothetical protein